MDDTSQGTPGYPPAYPPSGTPSGTPSGPPMADASAGGQPQVAYSQQQPPYAQPAYGESAAYKPQPPAAPAWEPFPPARKSRVWVVVLIVGLFLVGAFSLCVWAVSLIGRGGQPAIAGNAVALVRIEGAIAGTAGGLGGGSVTPEAVLDQLRQAENDRRVKAILLRVDSPGGTVAASEEIATEVGRATKPVVVSIGDVGASGAYMVSSQADWVVAAPGSSVGSIGVILEVANLQGLLDKLGVKFAVITAGDYKDIGSPYRSLTPTETKMLQEHVDIVYEQFIEIVARGRKLPPDKVRELATGMVWPGTLAKTYGLVDQIGTLNDAIGKAASLGGIRGTPRIVEYGRTPYTDLIEALFGISEKLGTIGDALEAGTGSGQGDAARPVPK